MRTATVALAQTNDVRNNLTYINTLISNATNAGLYFIIVDGNLMDDDMADDLKGYGYRVSKEFFDMGTYPRYKVEFGATYVPPTPTPSSSPAAPSPTPTPSITPTQTLTSTPTPTPTITPSSSSTHVAGADFTIEWYMKVTNWTSPTYHPRPYSLGSFPAKNAVSIENTGSHIYWWSNGTFYVDMGSLNISTNTWHHFAVARNNGVLSLFFDGLRLATGTNNSAIPSSGSPLFIGAEPNGSGGAMSNVNGKITNFRWNKSVIYDGPTYIPPTSPSTADSNTKLLLLATNSGGLTTDSSGLGKTITNVGATWDSDSPFAGGVGGSVNFAGTSYFTVPASTDWDV